MTPSSLRGAPPLTPGSALAVPMGDGGGGHFGPSGDAHSSGGGAGRAPPPPVYGVSGGGRGGATLSRATPLSDSLEQEFRVVDDRVEHYVSRFLLRSHQGSDAERQLTQIVHADLLRRTLDAESDKESEVARYKELLTDARRALVDAKQEGDLQWQQCAADAEERQRAAIEARDADADSNLVRVQADLERQLKAACDDMEARVALKDAAGAQSRETHEAELGKVRAELGAERRAHLELMRAMKASNESHRKERDESATRAHEQQSRDAADAEERQRAAIEARETHETELEKVRAELGAERHAHLELVRAMQAGDESRRKEHDESATRARIQQSRDAASAAVQRRRVQEQVAQVVASWEAEQRQREGAIQQRFFAQLQADSAEMLKQKEVEVLPAAHMAVTCSC